MTIQGANETANVVFTSGMKLLDWLALDLQTL
jgi:hypothetical protein